MLGLLLRFDRKQLAIADAAVAWLWEHLELSRRMLIRLVIVGMLLSQILAQLATAGRVDPLTLGLAAILLLLFASSDRRLGASSPELQRAMTLAHRTRPFPTFMRLAVWPWTAYAVATSLSSRALPLELAADLFFFVAIIASHALPPGGPRKRRRTKTRLSPSLTPSHVRFGSRA